MFDLVRVRGGIGNQLFAWALCERLRRDGRRVVIDASTLGRTRGFDTADLFSDYRRFDLGYRAWKHLSRIPGIVTVEEVANPAVGDCLKLRPRFLSGYWQSPSYFAGIEDSLESKLTHWMSDSTLSHFPSGPFAAIHVRRGDYVSDPAARQQLGPLDLDYYMRAIAVLRDLGHTTIRLFTDDPAWAAEEVAAHASDVFVESSGNAIRDLQMMSQASAIATANSTFSWWAAWLVWRHGGAVVRPDPWYLDSEHENVHMLPTSWQSLAR